MSVPRGVRHWEYPGLPGRRVSPISDATPLGGQLNQLSGRDVRSETERIWVRGVCVSRETLNCGVGGLRFT